MNIAPSRIVRFEPWCSFLRTEKIETEKHDHVATFFTIPQCLLLGLVIAMGGITLTQVTGNPIYDGMASVGIGVVLAATAIWLAIETKSLLIGERARPQVIAGIREMASQLDGVEAVNEVLTMHVGPEYVLVNISVDFEDSLTIEGLETAIEGLDRRIRERYPEVKKMFVEAESMFKRL